MKNVKNVKNKKLSLSREMPKFAPMNNACDCPQCDNLTTPHDVSSIGSGMVRCTYQCSECGTDWDRKMEPSNVY